VKIVQLTDLYAPLIGGLERHTLNLARELARRGHESVVVTLGGRDRPPVGTDEGGVRVHRLRCGVTPRIPRLFADPDRTYHPPVADPGVTRALQRVLGIERPDVVHGHNWMTYSYVPLRRRHGAALVHTLHDYGAVCHKRTYLDRDGRACTGPELRTCAACGIEQYGVVKSVALAGGLRLAQARLHPNVDLYLAVSRYVADVSRPHLGGAPLEVVPTFVPDGLDVLGAATPRPGFLPDRDYILFVGALNRFKGVDLLLEAHAGLGAGAPTLVLIGTPRPDTPRRLGPNVVVATDVAHDAVMSAWHHCLFGVVPSRGPEPLGQVAVEAMACAKAVVATRTGGLPDVVADHETGLLVEPADLVQLTGAMRRLIEDRPLRDALGAEGARRAPHFMQHAVVTRIEALYRRTLADRAACPTPAPPPDRKEVAS